jgi:hypothetical protein
MILTEIYFYGDHPDVQPYQGTLPFGLKISDDRNAVRSKLAALEKTRRSYVRDTWEADAFRMTIAYAGSEARIGFVLCMLRYSAPPPPPLELAGGVLPAINTIVGLLGVAANDQRLRDTFEPLGLSRQLRTEATGLEADFRSKYGFELRFGKVGSSSTSVLTQFLCYRDRELDSRQWEGQLPFGMHFDDSPETVQGRVGRPPDDREDEEVTGYAMWHSDAFDLYVYYSTMENFILSVRIVAPGVSNLGGD